MQVSHNKKIIYFHLIIACLSAGIINALLLVLLRIGLETHFEIALGMLVILGGFLFLPFFVWLLLKHKADPEKFILAFISVILLTTTFPLLAYIGLASFLLPLFIVLFGLGLHCTFKTLHVFPKQSYITFQTLWPCILAGVLFGLYTFLESHTRFYAGVFAPEHAALGILNRDTYFHSALANMIYEYKSFSMGAGGFDAIKYHFAFHVWLAPFKGIFKENLITILPFFKHIIMYPLLLVSIGTAVFANYAAKISDVPKLLCSLIALLFVTESIGWQSQWASESYAMGLIWLFFALSVIPVLAPLMENAEKVKSSFFNYTLLLLCILVLIALTAKISVGLILIGFAGFLCLRYHGFRYPVWALGVMVLLCLYLSLQYMQAGHGENFDFLAFLKERGVSVNFSPYIPLLLLGLGNTKFIKKHFLITHNIPIKYWETFCVTGFVCFMVPNLVYIVGGSGFYFIDIIRWIGIWAALWWVCANNIPSQLQKIGIVNQIINLSPWSFVNKLIPFAIIACLVFSVAPYVLHINNKHYILPASAYAKAEYQALNIEDNYLGTGLQGGLLGKFMSAVLQDGFTQRLSQAISKHSSMKDGHSAIYIPYDHPYWEWPETCAHVQGLYFQSMFSIPILNSYPYIKSEKCIYSAFRAFGQKQMTKPEIENKYFLCGLAKNTDFNNIYVLTGTQQNPDFKKISCSS